MSIGTGSPVVVSMRQSSRPTEGLVSSRLVEPVAAK